MAERTQVGRGHHPLAHACHDTYWPNSLPIALDSTHEHVARHAAGHRARSDLSAAAKGSGSLYVCLFTDG